MSGKVTLLREPGKRTCCIKYSSIFATNVYSGVVYYTAVEARNEKNGKTQSKQIRVKRSHLSLAGQRALRQLALPPQTLHCPLVARNIHTIAALELLIRSVVKKMRAHGMRESATSSHKAGGKLTS